MFRKSAMQVAVCWKESDAMRWHVRAPKPDLEPLLRPESNLEGESPRAIHLTRAGGVLQRNLKGRHSKELAVFLWAVRMSIK
jgi:hypothetical protein